MRNDCKYLFQYNSQGDIFNLFHSCKMDFLGVHRISATYLMHVTFERYKQTPFGIDDIIFFYLSCNLHYKMIF